MRNRSVLDSRLVIAQTIVVALALLSGNAHARNLTQLPGSAASGQSAAKDHWLRIETFTDIPLTNATVRVYDIYGHLLFRQARATDIHGRFHALIPDLPRDLRVTIVWRADSDGDDDSDDRGYSSASKVKLSADVRNFDPVNDTVYVNPATTIVSRLVERFPQLSLEQAKNLVRRLLGMPLTASFGVVLREGRQFHPAYFSETVFVREASRYGGIDRLIEALVAQSQGRPHLFAPAASPLGGVASFVLRNLASGALSWAGGQGAGWVARTAGLTTAGATAEAVANLQAGLDDLQSSVAQLSDQLTALQEEISAELTQTQYVVLANTALQTASKVNTVSNNLTSFATDCPPLVEGTQPVPPSEYCVNQKDTVSTQLKESAVNGAFEDLSTSLLDTQAVGYKGMLHLFSQSVGQSVRFFRPADSTKIQTMADYFQSVEIQAANLKVELQHFNGAPGPNGEGSAALISFLGNATLDPPTDGSFQTTLNNEAKLVFPAIPLGTVLNVKDRSMWATSFPDTSSCLYPEDNMKVPPPRVYDNAPQFNEVTWNNIGGWTSPTQTQTQSLISGWTGANPISWLIAESRAVAPDSPESAGFPLVPNNAGFGPQVVCPYGVVWTKTASGGGNYYLLNVYSGSYRSAVTGTNTGNGFIFLIRALSPNEQYFWYP